MKKQKLKKLITEAVLQSATVKTDSVSRKEFEELKRQIEEERKWMSWQANASHQGGSFGFGRTDKTAIERTERRWEPGFSA